MTSGSPTVRGSASPLAFVALLFALSVPVWVAGAFTPNPDWLPMRLPVSALQFVLPLVAAVVLVYRRERRPGIVALLRRTVSPRGARAPSWWLVVVALVPVMMAVTFGILWLAGAVPRGQASPLAAIPVLVVLYAAAAGCEEAGWTAYLLDPVRRRWGPTAAGLVIGAVWAGWHVVGFAQANRSPAWIAGQCLSTVAIRVLMVRLFDAVGRIVLAAVVVHTLVNVAQSVMPGFTERAAPAVVFGVVALTFACGLAPGRRRG